LASPGVSKSGGALNDSAPAAVICNRLASVPEIVKVTALPFASVAVAV